MITDARTAVPPQDAEPLRQANVVGGTMGHPWPHTQGGAGGSTLSPDDQSQLELMVAKHRMEEESLRCLLQKRQADQDAKAFYQQAQDITTDSLPDPKIGTRTRLYYPGNVHTPASFGPDWIPQPDDDPRTVWLDGPRGVILIGGMGIDWRRLDEGGDWGHGSLLLRW